MTDFCQAILSAEKIGRFCRSSDIPFSNPTLVSECAPLRKNESLSSHWWLAIHTKIIQLIDLKNALQSYIIESGL